MEQNKYKQNLKAVLLGSFCILLLYALIIYIIDPLQQFRMAKYHPSYISEIYQNAGVAKHAYYNTVILGSSMMENFHPSYVKNKLGLPSIKLSISGSNAYEESIALETAIATGKVKNVILGLDIFRFAINQKRNDFPIYLYSHHSPLATLQYLLNIDDIGFMLHTFVDNVIRKQTSNLDEAFVQNDVNSYSSQHVLQDFNSALKYNDGTVYSLSDMKVNFDKTILSLIKSHQEITFYLFFHPYSIYAYKLYEKQGHLVKFMQMKQYIIDQTKPFKNVKLYDFENDKNIMTNLKNYKDIGHYSVAISNYIVDKFANDNNYLISYRQKV